MPDQEESHWDINISRPPPATDSQLERAITNAGLRQFDDAIPPAFLSVPLLSARSAADTNGSQLHLFVDAFCW